MLYPQAIRILVVNSLASLTVLSHAAAQAPDAAMIRIAALTADGPAPASGDDQRRVFFDPSPYAMRSTPRGMERVDGPLPARSASDVDAMAKAARAMVAGPAQLIRCVTETEACKLPPDGTELIEISDPIIDGTRATVIVRSRLVESNRDGDRMRRAVRGGTTTRVTLEKQSGRWKVVKRDVLTTG